MSVASSPTTAMIHGRLLKNEPPSDPFGATTSVNAPEPKGTICDACRPSIGSCFLLVTSTSAVLRERPKYSA